MCAVMIRSSLILSLLAATALAPQAVLAQAMTEPTLVGASQSVPAVAPSEAELQALIFYIRQSDAASATAELRRLQAKFPGWTPPSDLGAQPVAQPSVEIDVIFRQIAVGQLAEARTSIATTRAAYRGWVPPADMTTLLELAEGQAALDAALDAGRADEAILIASKTSALLRCDRVNNAWRIAKAQEDQGAREAAVRTYLAITQACVVYPELVATLEKSDTVTTDDELIALFNIVMKRFPDESVDLGDVQSRLLAGRVAGVTGTGSAAPENILRPRQRPRDDMTQRVASAAPAPARTAEAAAAPSGNSGNSGSRRVAKVSSNDRQCLAQTEGTRDTQMLFSRGWCAYNLERPMDSLAAFRAVEKTLKGDQRRDARFGMALSYLKLNMTEDAASLAATTDLTGKQRVEVESIILDQRGVRSYQRGEFAKAIGYFTALEQVSGKLRRDLAVMRAYSYLNSGNRTKAHTMFQDLHNQLANNDTAKGLKASE